MLREIFYWILNMSILATIYGVLLYFLRYIRRMPRTAIYFLWAVVLFRMLCPVGFSSKYSLMSILEAVLSHSVVRTVPIDDMHLSLSNSIQAVDIYQPIEYKTQVIKDFLSVTSVIWLIIAAMAVLSMLILYFLSRARLRGAVKIKDNVYEGSMVTTPMICGIIHPRIILSPGMKEEELNYILAHEKIHVRRYDNLWRMLAITAACIHWFNPFSWLFLKLFFADCELACDESVVKKLSLNERKVYATTMLSYASADNTFFSSAFGGGVKPRIQRVLSYRRLTWFSILTFTLMAGVIAYILLTNGAA